MESVVMEPEVVDVVGPDLVDVERSEDLQHLRQEIEENVPSLGWEWG